VIVLISTNKLIDELLIPFQQLHQRLRQICRVRVDKSPTFSS
jgi:hypothetical protein